MRNFTFLFFIGSIPVVRNLHIKVALFFLVLLGFSIQESYAQPPTQWEISREITFSAATPMADFQVKIELNGAAQHAHMNSNGSDLRFYVGATPLNYWIERFNPTGLSVIWVKVPTASTMGLTMYYGNPTANTTSNGENTFDFFDGFSGSALNTSKWTINSPSWDAGSITVSSGQVELKNKGDYTSMFTQYDTTLLPDSYIIELKHKETGYYRNRFYVTDEMRNDAKTIIGGDYGFWSDIENGSTTGYIQWGGTAPVSSNTDYLMRWDITRSTGFYRWSNYNYLTENKISDANRIPYPGVSIINISVTDLTYHSTFIDWVRIRKAGALPSITIANEVIRVSVPIISTVSKSSGCEGEEFTISGSFQTNFGHIVKIDGNNELEIVSATGTEIVARFGTTSGVLTVTTLAGTSNGIPITSISLPIVDAGTTLPFICTQETSVALGGTVTGASGVWSVDIPGGTFNTSGGNFANTTWTAPAGFSGLVTFTLTGINSTCSVTDQKTLMVNETPFGIVTVSGVNFCVGEAVTFTAPSGYTGYEYLITENSTTTTINNGSNPEYTANNLKVGATVKVKVTNSGCVATLDTEPFTVNAIPDGSFTSSDYDNVICKGEAINFIFSSASYIGYKFILNGTDTLQKGGSSFLLNQTNLNNGDKITLLVAGVGGCSKLFGPITVTVHDNPTGELFSNRSDDAICVGGNLTFTASAGFVNYEFFLNGETSLQGPSATRTYTSGTGLVNHNEISVRVKNSNGCFAFIDTVKVTVNDLPSKPTIEHGQPTSFCVGAGDITLSVDVTPDPAYKYQWFRNSSPYGSLVTENTLGPLNVVSESGIYTVSFVNENGCLSPVSDPVVVTIYPVAAKPTVTVSGVLEFCEGGSVDLTSSVATNYQWYFGTNPSSLVPITGQTNQTLSISDVDSTGYYAVGITNINGCAGSTLSNTRLVTVNALPTTPEITVTGTLEFCEGGSVTLAAPLSNKYQWFLDNDPIPGTSGKAQNYIAKIEGDYTLQVTSAKGCFSALSLITTVIVDTLPIPSIKGPSTICLGTQGNEYITEAGMSSYYWTVTGGGTITSGQATNAVKVDWPTSAGVKTLNVEYANGKGCASTKKATFTNSPAVKPKITGLQEVCVGSTEIEYSTESGKTEYEWTISEGGAISAGSSTNTVQVTWTGAGPQTISVNYTNDDNCNAPAPTVWKVTVNPVPIAEFSYSATPYCTTVSSASPLMATGAKKGEFSFSPAGLNITTTGVINIVGSSPGTYTVTNTVAAAGGCAVVEYNTDIIITQLPTVSIGYEGLPFCTSDNTPKTVNMEAGVGEFSGGTFTAPTGLSIVPETGTIDPSNSDKGSYKVTYTIPASEGCPIVVVTTPTVSPVVITELPTVLLSYSNTEFCKSDNVIKKPSLAESTGNYSGGIYSVSPAGLNIDPANGYFTPAGSDAGNYTVTYTTPASAGCGVVTKTFDIAITEIPTASISYPNSSVCNNETSLPVTLSGSGVFTDGIYTSQPTGLSINAVGDINPSLSTPGTYTITYTIPLSGGCAAVPVTTSVTISPKPEVSAGENWATCVGAPPVNITQGADTTFASSVLWSGGAGTWSQATSLTGALYEPGAAETGEITLTLTATGRNGCSGKTSVSTKKLTINSLPLPVNIVPENAPALCVGGIQSFISVKNSVSDFNTGVLLSSTSDISIPDNATAGVSKIINVSGIPSNAVITSVVLELNVTHTYNGDLTINLKAPNGKVLNIANALPGPGFTNTVISSAANNPIQTSGDMGPFTGTYAAQMRFGTQGATSVSGNRAFAKSFDELFSIPNGHWILSARDGGLGDKGTFNSWSITVKYSIPNDPVPVFWTQADTIPGDLYIDAAVSIPYDGLARSVVYAKPTEAGAHQYTTTSIATTGCESTKEVTLNISPSPKVYIKADYCSNAEDGKIKLDAMGVDNAINYNWSTGETTASVLVDIAHEYDVSVTNSQGCTGTGILSVAEELVVNGDFEQGNTGFYTEYVKMPSPIPPHPSSAGNGLVDEGTYTVDTSAYIYHQDFHGRDHTTSAQSGKFMIVNGLSDMIITTEYPVSHKRIIWEQTVSVLQNTDYYFSAWATNFSGSNSPKLQFEVNGVPVGTVANLQGIPRVGNEAGININNWVRFYNGINNGIDDTWKSGENTQAVIRIINLEPGFNGNDFGLDDISFGTLAPFVSGPDVSGRDEQTICVGESVRPIVYKVGSGDEPISGLPTFFKSDFDGLNFTISDGTLAVAGVYEYVLTTTGNCPIPATATGKITVLENPEIELASATQDATLCLNNNLPSPILYTVSGAADTAIFTGLPSGITGVYNSSTGVASISGSGSVSGTFTYKVKTHGVCKADSLSGVIAVDALSVAGTVSSPAVCLNGDGVVKVTGYSGDILGWSKSDDDVIYTSISNTTDTEAFSNITQTRYYKVEVKNGVCPSVSSVPVTASIHNLWEGNLSSAWDNPFNWSSKNIPTVNTSVCGGTVTIPKVVGANKDPILTLTAGVTHLNVFLGGNLMIPSGGNLQVAGNITNSGTINVRNGGIEYTGSTARTIESGIFLNNAIGDLKISTTNTNGVTLNAPIDIYRSLTFGTGGKKLITNDQLTLKSTKEETASLGNMTGKTITGKATVERYINTGLVANEGHGKSWQLLATPTVGQSIRDSWQEGAISNGETPIQNPNPGYGTLLNTGHNSVPANGYDLYTRAGPSIKTYKSATGNYDEGPESTLNPIYNPNGYMILVRGDRTVFTSNGNATPTTLRTKGTFVTGNQTFNIPANSIESIGNPYASAIEISKIDKSAGIADLIMVWDPSLGGSYSLGGFVTLVRSGSNYIGVPLPTSGYYSVPVNYIQSGQAFLMQTAPNQAGSVTITENDKVSGSQMVMRKGNPDSRTAQLRTNLFGVNNDGTPFITDGTLHQFAPEYSNEIDGLDARKMSNTSENLGIKTNDKLIVVERRQPLQESDTLFFNLSGVRVQKYRFEFIAESLQSGNLQGYIEDLYSGTKTFLNMEGKTKYDFTIENKPGSYAPDRFRIVFKSALGPLPVSFTGINASQKKEDIMVTWNVENEINVLGYDVEKSTDGLSFTKIVHLPAKSINTYNWLDKDVQSGNHYYRIKAINENGKMEFTSIVKVLIQSEPSKITVYPNPITNGVVNVHLINQPPGKYKIRLLNPVGQVVVNKIVTHGQGNSIHPIDWDYKMARGIYQIEVTKPDGGVNLIKIIY